MNRLLLARAASRPGRWSTSVAARGRLAVAMLALQAFAVCCNRETAPSPAPSPAEAPPFDSSSPYNVPIPADPVLDRNTQRVAMVNSTRPWVSIWWYATPVYEIASRPAGGVTVRCMEPWGRCELSDEPGGVPLPAGARPSPGSDAHLVVWDRAAGLSFEFYGFRGVQASGGVIATSWGGIVSTTGNGVDRPAGRLGAGGATGSDISRLAGLVRVDEVRAGVIPHALVGPSSNSCASPDFRWPALKSDGWSTRLDCLPEGARLQLDPSIDLARVSGLRPIDRMVAVALQRYGWYNIDNGGSFDGRRTSWGVQFELDPQARGPDCAVEGGQGDEPGAAYCAAGLTGDYDALRGMLPDGSPLFSRMRVLARWDGR